MRWLPFFLIFLLAYIEISLFIKVASVLGVLTTLLLVILTSCIGISLVRNQGMKNFLQLQQRIASGENPAAEMVKSVSLFMSGFLLLLPGFFTDFLGLLLLLPPVQTLLTLKLLPHLKIYRSQQWSRDDNHHTFEGEYQRKDEHIETIEPPKDKKEDK